MAARAKKPKELPARIRRIVDACRGGANALPYHPAFGCRRRAHLLAGAFRPARRHEISRAGDRARFAHPCRRRPFRSFADVEGCDVSTLAQQAGAVETASRLVSGAAQKPSAREKAYLLEALKEAAVTLRNLEYERERI